MREEAYHVDKLTNGNSQSNAVSINCDKTASELVSTSMPQSCFLRSNKIALSLSGNSISRLIISKRRHDHRDEHVKIDKISKNKTWIAAIFSLTRGIIYRNYIYRAINFPEI